MKNNISKKQAAELIANKLSHFLGVTPDEATDEQFYKAVALVVQDIMHSGVRDFRKRIDDEKAKRVYYLSMEFLMGRSLKNNLFNLNLTEVMKAALADYGINLDSLYELEPDAGLGNGGLGRLAACYLDGLATQQYASMGYSILYEAGIFKQKLIDGWQTELPDFWLPGGEVWLAAREKDSVEVAIGGSVTHHWNDGYHSVDVSGGTKIMAVPYDMFVSGKDGKGYSILRLWKAKAASLNMQYFDQGQYLKSIEDAAMAEIISKVLYPSDNHPEGKSLRLKQQYFLVSASVQDIVKRHLRHYGTMENFAAKNAIHINDTHPTLAIPELMRILLDECGYGWDDAWKIITETFAYTNHTILAEALECWQEDLVKMLLPRVYEIIKEIDNRLRFQIWNLTNDAGKVERLAVISNGVVRMANLCVVACHSVNGVSALHSDIIKQSLFNEYYQLTPNKFTNVTNGIAHRRWLCQSNPNLTGYITTLIGDGFVHNADELANLKKYQNTKKVLAKIEQIKKQNKKEFAAFIKKVQGIELDPNSIFDVQVKRLHEYKRQHLNAFGIVAKYLEIKDNPNGDWVPHTYIFGAKAASGYFMAKKIIEFICALADLINNDPDVNKYLKVVYIEDYNVSMAEKLMPAADVSEQISLAGKEASGTGNMKLMINGAITLGTLDGANVEIHDAVGDDNIIIFGMHADEVEQLKNNGYNPSSYYNNNVELHRVIDFINQGFGGKQFSEIGGTIIHHDPYMVLADFADYRLAQAKLEELWKDREQWNRMSLINTASAGIFAADRAINDYARDIWHISSVD